MQNLGHSFTLYVKFQNYSNFGGNCLWFIKINSEMDGIYHLNADIGQTDMDKAIFLLWFRWFQNLIPLKIKNHLNIDD